MILLWPSDTTKMNDLAVVEKTEMQTWFCQCLASPDRYGLTSKQIAEKCGIGVTTVYNWIHTPEISDKIKELRADRIKSELAKVDDVLLKKAMTGDVKAIKLIYERWDDYIHKSQALSLNQMINLPIAITQSDGTK